MIKNLIIDFDSTIIADETMEVLFEVALENDPRREEIVQEIAAITAAGMNGEIPFDQSLSRRIALLPLKPEHIEKTLTILAARISPSFLSFINKYHDDFSIYVISGGFTELIIPILEPLGIPSRNIIANTFLFSEDQFIGIDTSSPLAYDQGKVKAVEQLHLEPEATINIGDGISDYQIYKAGLSSQFIYYGEFVQRAKVTSLADTTVTSFDGIEHVINITAVI